MRTAGPPIASGSSSTSSRIATELDEDCRNRLSKNPLRVFDCKVDGGKDFVLAAPTIADHLCQPCAAHFAAVRAGLDEVGVSVPARSTAGARPRLLHAVDVRVGLERSRHPSRPRRSTPAAGTTGSPRRSAGARRPGVGFAMGLDRVLLALEAEGAPLPPARGAAVLRGRDRRRRRRRGPPPDRGPAGRGASPRRKLRGAAVEGAAQDGRPSRERCSSRSSVSTSSRTVP